LSELGTCVGDVEGEDVGLAKDGAVVFKVGTGVGDSVILVAGLCVGAVEGEGIAEESGEKVKVGCVVSCDVGYVVWEVVVVGVGAMDSEGSTAGALEYVKVGCGVNENEG
jgi:hypothetical protein